MQQRRRISTRKSNFQSKGALALILAVVTLGSSIAQASAGLGGARVGSSAWINTTQLGDRYMNSEQYDRALRTYERSLSMAGRDRKALGVSLQNLGKADCKLARYTKSEGELKRALSLEEKNFGTNDQHLVYLLNELGQLYTATGRTDEASAYLKRAITINSGKDQITQAESLDSLAQAYLSQGDAGQASEPSQKSLELRQKNLPMGDVKIAESLNTGAAVSLLQADLKDAEQQASNALALTGDHQANLVERATSLDLLAKIYIEEGLPRKARALATEALTTRQHFFGNKHPLVGESWLTCGAVSLQMQGFRAAEDAFRNSLKIFQEVGEAKKDESILSMFALSCALASQGKTVDAKLYLDQAIQMQEALHSKNPHRVEMLRSAYVQALVKNGNWPAALAVGATAIIPPFGTSPIVHSLVSSCSKPASDIPAGQISQPVSESNELLFWCCVPIGILFLYLMITGATKELFFFRNTPGSGRKKKDLSNQSGTYWTEVANNVRSADVRVLPHLNRSLQHRFKQTH